ncbi:MAG: extracellular solute-binding protein [Paracoccaceae bacterium]|nr:extracellular solute-binding protein [Paracoccaceae bacterium]
MLIALLWTGSAAAQSSQGATPEAVAQFGPTDAPTLLLRSTTDIAVLAPAIEAFVAVHPGVAVTYEQWGSNALYDRARAECMAGGGVTDALFSSAVDQLVELVNLGCAQPHRSAATATLPAARRWRDELWGLTREPAVIIYNTRLVPPEDVPTSRFDLLDLLRRADQRYAGRVATYDVEASGLGYLFAFVDSLEATTFGALLEGFGRSGAIATCCSAEIIQGVSQGRYLVAYNVLGSYADSAAAPDVARIWPSDYTLVLSRGYMIPRAAAHPVAAAALLDFLLSTQGQAILAASGLVAQDGAAQVGTHDTNTRPIRIAPALLVARDAQKRAQFIRRWRETFPNGEGG